MFVFGLLAAMALGSAPSATSSSVVDLSWQAPTSCPSTDHVRTWIEALIPEFAVDSPVVRAQITVTSSASGYAAQLELQVDDQTHSRSLEAPDCVVLARAAAVVVAVSLDPVAVASSPPLVTALDAPPPSAPPSAPPSPSPTPAPPPRHTAPPVDPIGPTVAPSRVALPEAKPAPRLEWGVRLGPAIGGGVLPSAGVGALLAPFLGISGLHVRATAQYWTRRRISLDPRRDAAGEFRILTGGVRICPRLSRERLHIPLCGGVDAGAVFGDGTGEAVMGARTARAPWAGVVLEPGVELSATPWLSLWIALEGVISLYRPVFTIDGATAPWTAGAGGLRGLAGLQFHRPAKKP